MIAELKRMLAASLSRAFRLVLANGSRFDVVDRWQVAVGLTQVRYLYPHSDRGKTLDLGAINALEPLEELKQ